MCPPAPPTHRTPCWILTAARHYDAVLLQALLALEAGTTAALPDGLRLELEGIQSGGGLQHLQELQQQIKVRVGPGAVGGAG